ncbi:MAG TPA: aryl-sulfate sulfotransferase [Phototrophicaceae bacterium]|nr:aryl-sulfate sulfotransferase [Phototrophicaceae bacterium]
MNRLLKAVIVALVLLISTTFTFAQQPQQPPAGGASPFAAPDPNRPVGLTVSTDQVSDGYILLSIIQSPDVIMIDNQGRVVHTWKNEKFRGQAVYLLDNGDLLRPTYLPDPTMGTGGQWGFTNGLIERYSWDNQLVWSYQKFSDSFVGHHDIRPMPDGHVLMLAFEKITADQALASGRKPELIPDTQVVWSEEVIEIDPATNEIVWEWHVWDHIVQDTDVTKPNYGVIAENPGLIDLNYEPVGRPLTADWLHANAVAYNADLDQIMLSIPTYGEIWVIDHSKTTEETKGEAGNLIYRWGNPAAYDAGSDSGDIIDTELHFQHDPQWIPEGYPGAGDILIYDNGDNARPHSRIVQITPPLQDDGTYGLSELASGTAFGPDEPTWQYTATPPEKFFSPLISSAQRQPNGNTLIAEGLNGRVFEVNPAGETVWEYYFAPAVWVFRAERYNLPIFADLDLTPGGEFAGGTIWRVDCKDGSLQRLHAYLPQEGPAMQLFIDTHGDKAEDEWKTEACKEHGGRVE